MTKYIPNHIHQIWLQGWDKRPSVGVQYTESWKTMHPDWVHHGWDEGTLKAIFWNVIDVDIRKALNRLPFIVQKVDLWRLIVLYWMGGMYLDLDFVCVKSLDNYLQDRTFVVTEEHDGIIANGFIATVPGHPLIRAAIEHIVGYALSEQIYESADTDIQTDKSAVLSTTGPHAISTVWRFELANKHIPGVHIESETNLFFPMTYAEYDVVNDAKTVQDLQSRYPESQAVHVYWGSWTYNKNLFS